MLFLNIKYVCFCYRTRALILCGWSQDVDGASMPLIDRLAAFFISSRISEFIQYDASLVWALGVVEQGLRHFRL